MRNSYHHPGRHMTRFLLLRPNSNPCEIPGRCRRKMGPASCNHHFATLQLSRDHSFHNNQALRVKKQITWLYRISYLRRVKVMYNIIYIIIREILGRRYVFCGDEIPRFWYSKKRMRSMFFWVFMSVLRGGIEGEMEVGILMVLLSAGEGEGKYSVEQYIMQV